MAIQNTSNTELDNKKQKKRWLSRSFNFVAPAILGMGVGLAVKSCAVAMLCTAGTSAIVTAIVASASAGLITSALRETWKYHRTEKKQDANAKFWTGKRLTRLFVGATIGGAFGSLGFAFADEIKNTAGSIYEKATEFNPFNNSSEIALPFATHNPIPTSSVSTVILPETVETKPQISIDSVLEYEISHEEALPKIKSEAILEKVEELPSPLPVQTIQPDIYYTVEKNDNLWNIVKEHYNLTSNADIQRYTDGVAASNNLTSGTTANNINIGDKIMLPTTDILESHNKLALDWVALDEETKSRILIQNTVTNTASQPTPH